MKKFLFVVLLVAFSPFLFGQEMLEGKDSKGVLYRDMEDKLYENAFYQVKHKGQSAFTTDLEAIDQVFTFEDFVAIRDKMYGKEGIFKVELLQERKVLRVYHLSYIEVETIKEFVLFFTDKFHAAERAPFTF